MLLLALLNKRRSFLDLGVESIEALHVLPDLLDWEFDKHTCDLWSSLRLDQHGDEFEDGLTNLVFQVWVLLSHRWQKLLGGDLVFLLWSHVLLHLLTSWGLWNSLHHWLTWHLTHSLVHTWLWHLRHTWLLWHSLLAWHTWHLSSHVLLLHLVHVLTLVVWSVTVLLVASVVWLSWSTSHLSLILAEVGVHGFVLLHDLEQLLEDLSHMWVSNEVVEVESTVLLGLIFLEVRLVHGFFSLEGSKLFDLVMVDHEGLAFDGVVVEGLLGSSCGIWGLEADESI